MLQCTVNVVILYQLLDMYINENSIVRLFVEHEKKIGLVINNQDINVMVSFPQMHLQ